MRMRKKSWAEPFLKENTDFVIEKPEERAGQWHKLLDCSRLRIEIGSGKGDYFTRMAAMNPEEGWIGIEKEHNVAAVAVKKALAQPHEHMAFIAQDADQISAWFAPGEVDVIHLNFSDPVAEKRLCQAAAVARPVFKAI